MNIEKLNNFVAHGFLVDDINKQKEFYVNNLGYEIGRENETFVKFEKGPDGGLFLWSWEHISKHLGVKDIHRTMQAIKFDSRAELDEAWEYLKDKVNVVSEPKDWTWNAYAGYFVDPQNYLWELWTWEK